MIAAAVLLPALMAPAAARAQPLVRVGGSVVAIDYSADGKSLAVGYDAGGKGNVAVYRARSRSGKAVELPALDAGLAFVGFAAGGELVAAADRSGTLVVWKVDDQQEVFRIELGKRAGTGSTVHVVANPRGPQVGWLAIAKGATEGTIEVAHVPGGKIVASMTKTAAGAQVRWSAHGGHVVVGGGIWNWDTLKRWRPKVAGVAATSDDGARVVSTSPDNCDGFLTIAEIATGKVLRSIPLGREACPRWIWYLDSERGLVWVGPDQDGMAVFIWDQKRDRQRRLRRLDGQPVAVALSADRRTLALSTGKGVEYIPLR